MNNKELSKQAKEYFLQIRKTDRLIQRLTDTVSTLRSGLISQNYQLKPDKIQNSSPKDIMADTIAKIVDLESEINQYIDELIGYKQKTFVMIRKVTDLDQQNILIARYVQLKSWEKIAEELELSLPWVYELHGRALIVFAEQNFDYLQGIVKNSKVKL